MTKLQDRDWVARVQSKGFGRSGKVLTVLGCAWFLSAIATVLIENRIPTPPPVLSSSSMGGGRYNARPTLESYDIIIGRNLFNQEGKIGGEDPNSGIDDNAAPVRTSLPFNLVGTVIFKDPNRSLATIEDKGAGQVFPVRIEDEIPSKARIRSIEARKVVFINLENSRPEFIDLPEDTTASITPVRSSIAKPSASAGGGKKGVEKVSSTQFNVSRAELDAAFANFGMVLTQAKALPNFENGQQNGYKLTQIVPNSIYDKIGMKNDDVILGINNESVNDPAKAFGLLNELKTSNHLELRVKRNGKETVINYDIN